MIYKIVQKLVTFINVIVPKNKKYVFLRSYFPYPDNIQAILDEMIAEGINKDKTIICAGNGFETYRGIQNVKLIGTSHLRGILWFLVSKYAIWDSAIYFNVPANKKQVSVNVWHGVSLKKIGFYANEKAKPYRMSTYATSYSDMFAKVVSKAFGIPLEAVTTTGEPRNDYLFTPATDQEMEKVGIPMKKGYKYVIWMPTFRQSKNHPVNNGKVYEFGFPFLSSTNIVELNEFAKKNNIILIMKWHGSQILPAEKDFGQLTNLVFLTTDMIAEQGISFYRVVSRCDALITDYSSIYVNYMVLDRPICFAFDDVEEYIADRGFMFDDIEAIMPGFKARSMEDIFGFIEKLSQGEDEYKAVRAEMSSILNRYNDNKNSARLLEVMGLKK